VGTGRGEPTASKIAATRFNEGNASLRLAAVSPRLPGRVDTNSTSAVIWWRDLRGAEGEGEGEGVIEFYKGKRINGENASTRSQRSSLDWWRCCSGYPEMTCVHASCEHERACLSAFHEFVWVLTLSLLYYATIANWLIFSFFRFTKLSIFRMIFSPCQCAALTVPFESTELEKSLIDIVKSSATLWKAARNDEMKIMIEKHPDLHSKEKWHAEDIEDFEEAPIPPDETVNTMGIQSLCLFPTVLQTTSRSETVVLHQGSALFADSRVWVQGMLEKKEHEQKLAKAVMNARSKVNARRTSFPTGPNSPTGGKFSKA